MSEDTMQDFDTPWNDALEHFWPDFVAFFFADIDKDIDWSRGYESLDKELESILSQGEMGKRLADKLFKVWRKNGEETWVLIHVEVQAQWDADFPLRMYIYNYRIFERYQRQVVSLAVLADENPNWRPDRYRTELWGCESLLRFPIVKLLDYGDDLGALEADANPFGLLVSAHLQSQATRGVDESRFTEKIRLVKLLLDRGMVVNQVRHLFRFIDWLMNLPVELEERFQTEIYDYQKGKNMTYISNLERKAMEKGIEQGIEKGIEQGIEKGIERGRRESMLKLIAVEITEKYPDSKDEILARANEIADIETLQQMPKLIWNAKSIDEIRNALSGK